MTTAREDDLTRDPAALQRLPEDDQPPIGLADPTCATTGVTAHGMSRPAPDNSRPADEVTDPGEKADPDS